jgi:predicted nucleic acid-binding Zn ribbon protein
MIEIPLTPEEELVELKIELKKQKKRKKRLKFFIIWTLIVLTSVAVILLGKT